MRRLILELSLRGATKRLQQQIEKFKEEGRTPEEIAEIQQGDLRVIEMLQKVRSFEMLHILRLAEDGFAVIFRVELKDPSLNFEELITNAMKGNIDGKFQLLEHEKENTYTCFVKGKHTQLDSLADNRTTRMYPVMPFTLRDGKVRVTLLGDNKQVKEILESAERTQMGYKIISSMEAKFSPSSPVSRLTEKQQDALALAFKLGYFDTPRKVSSEQLAQKLGLASSTLVIHLRRAERRLLSEMFNE
jgi:predicted DNA binding protein